MEYKPLVLTLDFIFLFLVTLRTKKFKEMYNNITRAILNVLQKLNKPTEADEIAFRVRSTPSHVQEHLEKMMQAHLVNKEGLLYSIDQKAITSNLESIYHY